MKNTMLVAALAVLLAGCAAPKWRHATNSEQDFYRDNAQCLSMSGYGQPVQAVPGANPVMSGYNQGAAMQAVSQRQAIHEQCMFGKGYYLK